MHMPAAGGGGGGGIRIVARFWATLVSKDDWVLLCSGFCELVLC